MTQLIRNDDLRRLFIGAGGAVSAGLLIGAAMRPDLNPDGLIPPQIALGESPHRTPTREGEVSLAAYGAHVPDYVVGLDTLRMQQAATQPVAYADPPPEDAGGDVSLAPSPDDSLTDDGSVIEVVEGDPA